MGTACGVVRKPDPSDRQVVMPLRKLVYKHTPTLSEMKRARIGPFFLLDLLLANPKHAMRLEKWNRMLNSNAEDDFPLESFISEDAGQKKLFRKRLMKGPPPQYRWQAWTAIRELSFRINEKDYDDLPRAKSEIESQISKDLGRTFPNQPFFNLDELGAMGQDSLFRLLSKLAGKYPNIGYCQGMNFVAGFMLLVSGGNEVEVFYLLEDLLLESKLAGFYSKHLPYLRKCQHVFKLCLEHCNPTLSEHFRRTELPDDTWVFKWLLTLYAAALPLPVVLRIWDHYLALGVKVLFKVGLTFLKEFHHELVQMDIAQLGEFLRATDALEINPEHFITKTAKFRISDKKLRKFELDYKPDLTDYGETKEAEKDIEDAEEVPRIISGAPSRQMSFEELGPDPETVAQTISTAQPEKLPEIPSQRQLFTPGRPPKPKTSFEYRSPSKVPVLPSIHKQARQLLTLDQATSEYEGDDEDVQEPLNARLVLEDLLREKSNISVISLNSISNLPRKPTPEVDKFIKFVNRLPL